MLCAGMKPLDGSEPLRRGREEGADRNACTAHFSTQEGAGAGLSGGAGRDGLEMNSLLGRHDPRGCGCRYHRTAGR